MISISRQNLQNAITDVLTCRSTLPACRLIKTDVLFRLNPKERNLSKPISRPSTVGVAVSSLSKCFFLLFQVPDNFRIVVQATLREFYKSIVACKDSEPSWKKAIYKVIARMDDSLPEYFKSPNWMDQLGDM